MATRAAVQRVLQQFESSNGDAGKDAVKAVRLYARVTGGYKHEVASYCLAVANKLEELATALNFE